MSSHHLPAGQNIPPAQGLPHAPPPGVGGMGGPGRMQPPVDMAGGPPAGTPVQHGAHHPGHGGPRRRQHQYHPQQHQPHQSHQPYPMPHPGQFAPHYYPYMNPAMQGNYGMPYGHNPYPVGFDPYANMGGMPAYMQQQGYPRSPPAMPPQYSPMSGVTVPGGYQPRHSQPSPALSTPYQPPPAPHAPLPPQTPSSTHSSQMAPPPTPPVVQQQEQVPPPPPAPEREPSPEPVLAPRTPFHAPLPWFSHPDEKFPTRKPRTKARRGPLNANSEAVSMPPQRDAAAEQNDRSAEAVSVTSTRKTETSEAAAKQERSDKAATAEKAAPASPETPSQRSRADTATSATPTKSGARPAHPAVPVVPAVPKNVAKAATGAKPAGDAKKEGENDKGVPAQATETASPTASTAETEATEEKSTASAAPKPPMNWAKLAAKTIPSRAGTNGVTSGGPAANGDTTTASASLFPGKSSSSSLADAIRAYNVEPLDKVAFIEPRGLVNAGNMCYMNSVLQVLIFCAPFYDFLNQVKQRVPHRINSPTPLIEAIIMYISEFNVLKSASSVEQLRRSLKAQDLEKFGEPFTPEFVYDAIRKLSRFASMERGHQQDAEEFLGFLLQTLDDECTHMMGPSLTSMAAQGLASEASSVDGTADTSGDWQEVGKKQKAAVSRSSGTNVSTPINKIFGGLLRSEFRVPGKKDSITTEPYQPLQLDIGAPDVRNVVDALRGLTRTEKMQGDFNSPRGKDLTATKQVFIETLPPVLILHLKRFQFDAEGHGTVKIGKHIDYPLDLEIPREILSRQKRATLSEAEAPRYKLIGVVYHHGKNASGGHYTADVRRQDGEEWLRLDDTALYRVRSQDVAKVSKEDETRDNRKDTSSAGASANRFGAMNDEDTGDEGWSEVSAPAGGKQLRYSTVANGGKAKHVRESVRDNKVAYLLFYQRV